MIDVVCFCGHAYSFAGDAGACPRCGEPLALSPVDVNEGPHIDAELDQLLRRLASELPPEELAA
jgi:hypothetical protein